ncbi:MAG TPA: hypothetical protein VGD43_03900, partial [Micromonospora sp.]
MTDGGRDHGLARLDGLGDPAELRARAAQAMRDLDPDPRPSAPQQGADPSDSVWVTVDMVGTVVDVSISRCWPDRLAADQLGDAILAAYSRARAKRAAAIALARMRAEETGSGPDSGDEGRPTEPYDPNMPDIHDARWLGWV